VSGPDAEDAKIVTLARAARARARTDEGAAVRDTDGRTYVGTTVALPSLALSALQAAVAAAVSSGATGLEAAALVTAGDGADPAGRAAVRDLGPTAPVHLADPTGSPRPAVG
jgi:cytidine deaminase